MNNLHHIATTIANEYDRHPNDLKRKRYSKLTNIKDMKNEFVRQCCENEIGVQQIADYLDHHITSVSRIITEAGIERTYKTDLLLDRLKENDTITVNDSATYQLIDQLRKKGYCIVNVGKYQYQLLDTPSKT